MVKQDIKQGAGRIGQQRIQHTGRQGGESRIRGGEDRERAVAGQGTLQAGRQDGGFQDRMVGAVDDDVQDRIGHGRRQQDGINDMHDAVVRQDIGDRNLGVVDENTVAVDGDRHLLSIEHDDGLAVLQVLGERRTTGHMIQQDICEGAHGVCQQGIQGTGRQGGEGRIRRREDRERSGTGQGTIQAGSQDGCLQDGVVGAVDDNVQHRVGRRRCRDQDRIHDMDHAVVRHDIRDGDLGIIDKDTTRVDGDRHRSAVQHQDGLAVLKVLGESRRSDRMVQEDVRQRTHRVGQQVVQDTRRQRGEGRIRRCKDREWTRTGEGPFQTCGQHGRLQRVVVRAVHHDIRDGLPERKLDDQQNAGNRV